MNKQNYLENIGATDVDINAYNVWVFKMNGVDYFISDYKLSNIIRNSKTPNVDIIEGITKEPIKTT